MVEYFYHFDGGTRNLTLGVGKPARIHLSYRFLRGTASVHKESCDGLDIAGEFWEMAYCDSGGIGWQALLVGGIEQKQDSHDLIRD
ncbi:hypothetical protein RAB80_017043 [Fusarium oxysporum f. sp. vasinfectum]|nr:hypothetical protein RAB80_017043 [Fusarium oxysporum f. sp. vasinfectum]